MRERETHWAGEGRNVLREVLSTLHFKRYCASLVVDVCLFSFLKLEDLPFYNQKIIMQGFGLKVLCFYV